MGVKKRARVYERAGAPTRRKGFPLKFHRNKRNTTGNKIKDLTGGFWNARFISVFPCGEVNAIPPGSPPIYLGGVPFWGAAKKSVCLKMLIGSTQDLEPGNLYLSPRIDLVQIMVDEFSLHLPVILVDQTLHGIEDQALVQIGTAAEIKYLYCH